ncbi:putative UDP-glucuronate:xylan alpha-glucuronosyltransferase 3 [Papaver somniferum]|uniref:putative UDP-glucuronate:xylan alpha-glucuronosyltransferase 3 n=1 Tax=Papaver somniferum TaxID=3469 RepID=UPI000E701079|nr:putative UDP-glucuronate:xylan alpha-glucuronosyltransferase 3 [Papaver somniferum]XP_026393233.1 putative UDP-glucuronate:xylan alpha-glucuronosyltransferase 3 [Papaver somniferum]
MRGSMGNHSPNPMEHRLRLSGSFEDSNNKRRFLRSKSSKEVEKPYQTYTQEKSSKCKISTLKLVLLIIVCGTFLTLLHSPTVSHNEQDSRPSFVDRWLWERPSADARYISDLDINWVDISESLSKLTEGQDKIGLLNFNESEIGRWREEVPNSKHVVLHLDSAGKDVTWESLYPEWIDEEEESEVPVCPSLPRPKNYKNSDIDLIAVKLPCRKSAHNWSRDVARLHLQLAAARISASAKKDRPVPVLFVTDCFPLPNLFTCKELVTRQGNAWLYNPKLDTLNQKLQLPIGSCELSLPVKAKERGYSGTPHREAYATILHSAHVYVCGAIAAAQSIRMVGSTRDFVILVDDTISEYHRSGLAAAGWKIRTIERIRNPKAEENAYNEWNYSKFRLWQLTDYDKIIFIDADLLILRNIDFLFGMPEITATGNNATLFNSGVMVIEPSNCTFQLLMDHINEIESYNGGDQGYLNEIFTWWHRIPKHMNFLKHFWEGDEEEKKVMKTTLFGADPPVLYVLHYLGLKPWLCFRDYDCNWNVDILQEFASDVAHKTWWKVHDAMPENLQKFCLLRSKQKAGLEWDRRQAEKGNFTDRHWNITITDERLKTCFEDFCFWESMLWHWGETNWTDDKSPTTVPTAPAITQTALPSL